MFSTQYIWTCGSYRTVRLGCLSCGIGQLTFNSCAINWLSFCCVVSLCSVFLLASQLHTRLYVFISFSNLLCRLLAFLVLLTEGLGRPRLLFSLSGYFCLYAYIRLLVCFLERFSFCLLYNDLTRLRCEVFNFYFQVSIIVNMTSLVFCYSNYDDWWIRERLSVLLS